MTVTPTDAFVPLTTASPAATRRGDFRVLVAPAPADVKPFMIHHLAPAGGAPAAPASPPACEPQVALQREGDRVTGIQIRCSCGQVMNLLCHYATDAAG